MPSANLVQVHLDSEHCRAICDEIGERLRAVLSTNGSELPLQLRRLLTRLEALDWESPSIAPSMEDMQWRATADALEDAI